MAFGNSSGKYGFIRTKWHGDRWRGKVADELAGRLQAAAEYWVGIARHGVSRKINSDGKTPSGAGEYPAMRSRNFARAGNIIAGEVNRRGMYVRVGLKKGFRNERGYNYAKALELGTRRMAARPWMSLTNNETRQRIKQILTANFPRDIGG